MTISSVSFIVAGVFLAAVLLDLWLFRWTRRFLKGHGLGNHAESQGVYLFGAYSPLLTWLKYRRLPGWVSEQSIGTLPTVETIPAAESSATQETVLTSETPQTTEALSSARTSRRWLLLEGGLIFVAVFLYCSSILDLGKPTNLPGNESGVFQALDWTLVDSLRLYGRFPLWNPYLNSGLPYIADPMSHIFNPVSTIPVLLLGVREGFKAGIFLSFMLAAFGMWWLSGVLGIGRPARLFVALMFVFAGQPVARFFQGQYLFVLGFAWIPWTVGSLFMLAKTGRRVYWATTVFFLALLFFSGNVYYSFYMLIFIGLFFLVYVVKFQWRTPFVAIDRKLAAALIITGALALGAIAVQFLPLAEFWPHLNKSLEVAGSHSLRQIILDYTSKDTFRPDAYIPLPAREEFYAYIGKVPFLALALLPFALWKRERRPALVFGLMFIFTFLWVGLDTMPWREAFIRTKLFLQFRHLLRILIYGSFALFLLGGVGIDAAWKLIEAQMHAASSNFWGKARVAAANVSLAALGALMLIGVGDVYQTNRKYIQTQEIDQKVFGALSWLRQHDLSDYYVRLNPNNTLQDAVVSAGLRFIEAWYHFGDIRDLDHALKTRIVQAKPNYILQLPEEPPPDSPGAEVIQQVNDYNIYRLPASLPYAFSVANDRLFAATNIALDNREVIQQTTFTPGPNSVEVIASAQANQTLVVLSNFYTGWELSVDDRPQVLRNVGGYLAAELLPGVHKYTFSFKPRSFYVGLALTLLSMAIAITLLVTDTQATWRDAFSSLRSLPKRLEALRRLVNERNLKGRLVTDAVFLQGSLHPQTPLNLEENATVHLVLEPETARLSPGQLAWQRWTWASAGLAGALIKMVTLTGVLTFGALAIYSFTRFFALERFPIYFFGDEAVQSLFAEDLIAHNFHSQNGTLFPIYVEAAGNRWTPLLSMYFHALTLTLFGKSIVVSRATSAFVSLLGVGAVWMILRKIFKARYAWAGVLLVAVTPAWFLHSRTAFETVMTTAFYACFLLFYLLYLTESPRYLYAAVIFGAATFYSYSNAQAIILAAAGMLFVADFRYHLRNREVVFKGLVLALLLAIPFIEFRLSRPQAIAEHLRVVGSYWFQAIPFSNKLLIFTQKYLYGLSPQYWFFPNSHDLPRHRMLGFGQMQTLVLPLVLLGLAVSISRWRSSTHRAVLLAALATPVGAALVDVGIARVLAFIIPANLLAALGLEWLLDRWKERLPYRLTALALFVVLAWANLALLRTALVNGPLWFRDYGLYGMQYGARQLFEEAIPEYLKNEPDVQVLVTSTWANGADNLLRFFFTPQEQPRVRMDGVESYLFKRLPLNDDMVFVMDSSEYQKAKESAKFGWIKLEKVIPYPDGSPGFYFARLRYADDVDAIFAAEQEARKTLVTSIVNLDGQNVELRYSQIDMGIPDFMFDGDLFTLMRGMEANPFILEFYFPQPGTVNGLSADFGLVNITLTAKLYPQVDGEPAIYNQTFMNSSGSSQVEMRFANAPEKVAKVHLEILNILSGETANIHIRELHLLP